jgi:hypothetical protein
MTGWFSGAGKVGVRCPRRVTLFTRLALGLSSTALASSALFGCAIGKLTDDEKQAFTKQLKEHYTEKDTGADKPSPAPDAAAPAPSPSLSATVSAALSATAAPSATSPVVDAGEQVTPSPSVPECAVAVFAASCAGGVCHYGDGIRLSPNLERDNLVELLSQEGPGCANAAGKHYLNLNAPADSYLRSKIRGEQPEGCGDKMPPTGQPQLSAAQLQCLEDWFASLSNTP